MGHGRPPIPWAGMAIPAPAGIAMQPLLLGGHLRVTSPLPAITAAHGAEQAARHACSHRRFSCRGLEDAGEGLGQGEHGVPGDRVPMFSQMRGVQFQSQL
jgi:hypothetical protein